MVSQYNLHLPKKIHTRKNEKENMRLLTTKYDQQWKEYIHKVGIWIFWEGAIEP